ILGFDINNQPTGTKEFFLADFRFSTSAQDYILDHWSTVDLTGLGDETRTLKFNLESTDITTDINGNFLYYNTPLYFAADNLTLVPIPEPASLGIILLFAACLRRGRRGLIQ